MERTTMDRGALGTGRAETKDFDHDFNQTLNHELEHLRADLRQLRQDLASLGGDSLRAARAGAGEGVRAAAMRTRAAKDAAEEGIASHPFLSTGAALAVGLLLGLGAARAASR